MNSNLNPQNIPKVALVGRPNVGKSTLFNRLLGHRQAVVAEIAGTTRDRLDQIITEKDRSFVLMDMAGLEPALNDKNEISQGMQNQVQQALKRADLVVWVVDSSQGMAQDDHKVASLLRNLKKPVIVASNKADDPKHDLRMYEFAQFGFEEVVAISALHGRGKAELFEAIFRNLPEKGQVEEEAELQEAERELKIGILGRPNVGKSTLLNALTGEDRVVVSSEAGTTRDSVDTLIPAKQLFEDIFTKFVNIRLIDTAGIRRRGKIGHQIEAWSVIRSMDTLDRSDVVLLLIDATEGLVHQDLQVINQVVEAGRTMILMLNKWDLVLEAKKIIPGTIEDENLQEKYLDDLRVQVPFLHWIQVLFMSAEKKINLEALGILVNNAYIAWNKRIDDWKLESFTDEARKNPRLKNLLNITYEHSCPPVFHIHTEGKTLMHFSTIRLLENLIRESFQIGPTPIKIWVVPSVEKNKHRNK